MKAISKYQSYVSFSTLLQWATLNGAEALQYDEVLGSLEKGKTPGLNLLLHLEGSSPDDFRICADTKVQRLI